MRALIGRELRARSVLFLVALAAAALGIWSGTIMSRIGPHVPFLNMIFSVYEREPGFALLSRLLLNGLFIGSLFFALLLGYLQVAIESKHGTEAFLLHQPVSRDRILTAKFLAGLILYLGSLLPAFLSFVIWTATPWGHFGPFRWEMAYPGLTRIGSAFIVYPAALWLIAARGRERVVGAAAVLLAIGFAVFFSNLCKPVWNETGTIGVSLILLWGAGRAYVEREL